MQIGEGCDAGRGRRTQNFGPAPLSQFSGCTALNRPQYRVSLVYRTAAAANQPEIRYFTAQSYQYVRWPRLLTRCASRPKAGHFLDAITIQIFSFVFNYKCIYPVCSISVLFLLYTYRYCKP